MRFIFLSQGYHPEIDGGANRYAAEVAELLAARSHEVHVVAKNPGNSLPEMGLRNGVRLYRMASSGGGPRSTLKEINRETDHRIRRLLHDSNHATLLCSHHAYFESAARRHERVCFLHGPWGIEHRWACDGTQRGAVRRFLDSLVAKRLHQIEARSLATAKRVFVASQYVANSLKSWHPSVQVPVEVVGGGVNHKRFHAGIDRLAARQKLGVADGDFLILAVRRLDPRMGLGNLVDAFARIAASHPRAKLWIAGRGTQQSDLENRIAAAHLTGRARLLGFVDEAELPAHYAAADLVVMPSLDLEGFGLVTAEAMACGTPVIASRTGANAEVVGPFDPTLVFDADPNAVAELLTGILAGRHPLPDRARVAAHALQRFRWETAADALERAWDEFSIPPEIPDRK